MSKLKTAICEVTPGAVERIDYFQMLGYSYEGYDYNGMYAWFSFKKPNVQLHVRPPVIQNHKDELAGYATTKAIVSFPADKDLPLTLIKELVRASIDTKKDAS